MNIHREFRTGNPQKALETLRSKVQEGLDIAARIRWDSTAVPLIDTLSMRDAMFTVELAEFRDKPLDPEDSITDLDLLVSKVEDVIDALNDAKKNWNEKSAMSAQLEANSSRIDTLQDKVTALQKGVRDAKAAKVRTPTPQSSSPQPGFCMKVGCGRKIEKWKKGCGWKLCATCLLEVRSTHKPAKLTDGTTWEVKKALACLGQMASAGVPGIPAGKNYAKNQRRRAMTLKRVATGDPETESSDNEQDVEEDPEYVRQVRFASGTEALVKRLRGTKARKMGKRTKGA